MALEYESRLVVCHECGRICKPEIDERYDIERLPRHKEKWQGKGYRPICHGSEVIVEIHAKTGAKVGQYEEL